MLDITVTVVFKAVPGTIQQTIGCGLPLIEKTNKHKTNGSFFFYQFAVLKLMLYGKNLIKYIMIKKIIDNLLLTESLTTLKFLCTC